ncbi:MAG: ATP-dependent helicase HrpB [Alphaproteobacteria bacterium]|nr:MAG: ATP-dependent helicase HrpB [Alphaproteobacteria bacterium]
MRATTHPLPIDAVLPEVTAALAAHPRVVLQAPPGAGKTTRVPLALLAAPWRGDGRILVLEPRRLATRAAASRLAVEHGSALGSTIGYRVRHEARVSAETRVEVLTTGLYLRRLQADPGLDGVAAVLFDEVHERAAELDLALALTLETAALREDLRLLAMSATVDGAAIAALFGPETPIIRSEGRLFPVSVTWLGRPTDRLGPAMASAIRRAVTEGDGDVLAFLPGLAEIRRTEQDLAGLSAEVLPLHGDLPLDAQDRALKPHPAGLRRVILATSIAETSLTLEGVRAVVDSGLARVPRFDPGSGMGRLDTVAVSQATAEQRRGRAGSVAPGRCYRLWSEPEHRGLAPFPTPEIVQADLAPLALALAEWGAEVGSLAWLDQPPAGAFAQAQSLLRALGALDDAHRITSHGRAMAALPVHPRLAHMLLLGAAEGAGGTAAALAALLSERDLLRGEVDLRTSLEALRRGSGDPAARQRIRQAERQLRGLIGVPANAEIEPEDAGALIAEAYPDRIGQARGARGQVRLTNGRGAALAADHGLAGSPWLAVADLDGDRTSARIFRAAPLRPEDVERVLARRGVTIAHVGWDAGDQAVVARRQRRLGALVLEDKPLPSPDPAAVRAALLAAIRAEPTLLPWSEATALLQARVALMRGLEPDVWPDLSTSSLLARLDSWAGDALEGLSRASHLARLDLASLLRTCLPWALQQRLDQEVPTHWTVPTGSRIALDYTGERPVLAVRLQEMFGCAATPRLAQGRVPVVLHLLSPARRPVQVTEDLAGFWSGSYKAVRAELRGRYPKHPWPDDPLTAPPTTRAKPRGT